MIIEVLTPARGRHAGLVRGGAGRTLGQVLQPGAQLSLEWNARLADHLGVFRVDVIRARAAAIMADRPALAALNAVRLVNGARLCGSWWLRKRRAWWVTSIAPAPCSAKWIRKNPESIVPASTR